jgi:hypothetical protein
MTELSPAAQAVFWAFNSKFDWIEDGVPGPQYKAIATAIEALVDQVVPASPDMIPSLMMVRYRLLAIANELEQLDD